MTSFASFSSRLLRRLLHATSTTPAPVAGERTVLDGMTAVAAVEASLTEAAALGASYPAAAAARAWHGRERHDDVNRFGEPLAGVEAETPRGALAATVGLALSGQRATAFLSGPDLAAAIDLLAHAAGQHVPLVVHLATRATAGHAQALGTGHEAYHAASDCGFFQFFAGNVQEAVDLALIARRVAERALVPGLVAMDGEQTAMAVQEVALPDDELARSFVGEPFAHLDTPTDAQRWLFGDHRRRVPRLHDLERPMMLSPLQGPESWGHGRAGARPYFADHVPAILDDAVDAFAELTGRRRDPLLEHRLEDARVVLVAQGSAVETAVAVAETARRERIEVGVLGVRCLRPFPGAGIVRGLGGAAVVAVLERLDTPLAGEGPLLREVRAWLDRARENARFGDDTHPGCPALRERDAPRLVDVAYGLGGLPLRGADLMTLVRRLETAPRSPVYLGVDFVRARSDYPKQQALMDALRRDDPQLAELGLRSTDPPPDLRPEDATTIAIHRRAGPAEEPLAGAAAAVVHEVFGGFLRSRPALTWQRFDEPCLDTITHAAKPLGDPGDDVPVDIAVVSAAATLHAPTQLTRRLARGAAVLMVSDAPQAELASLPTAVRRCLRSDDRGLYVVPLGEDAGEAEAEVEAGSHAGAADASWRRMETLLGGLIALLRDRRQRTDLSSSKLRSARAAALEGLPEDERERRLDAFVAAVESLQRHDLPADEPADVAGAVGTEPVAPAAVRGLTRSDDTMDCLPRFWDQVGILYRDGATETLTANPYLAVGAVPPLSSTFRDVSDARSVLPVFDPATCDGDPRLWTSCPDGSVAPLVISARALLDAGIALAGARGRPADALRSVAGRLAQRVNRIVADAESPPTTAAGLFRAAMDDVLEKMDAAEERTTALREALEAVVTQVGVLPLARTPVFFDEPERAAKGSGELLVLVVNPDACKSPAVVLAAGEGRGLKAVAQTPETIEAARRLWTLWEELPDTAGATIERARTHPDVGPLAAVMLSRHCLHAMAGGDGAEAGSGGKLALRQVLAVAEFHLQPRLQKHLGDIESLRSGLADRIRDVLAEALPTRDLEALGEGLDLLGRTDVDLGTLSEKIDTAVTGGHVDGGRLGRLVDAARGLADLEWRIGQGPDGLGRSRVGLAIAPGHAASWAGAFPYNPFQAPVVIDAGGETGHLARGLLEGQLRHVLAGVRLMRSARAELEQPADAARVLEESARLRFADLTPEERALCPPMLVVGDGRGLGGRLGELVWLLGSGLPVKVVVLSDAGGGADAGLGVDALGGYPADERFDLALLALLTRRAFVTQTSVADTGHFADSVSAAFAFDGPALVHVHAPSPERHGFPAPRLREQAELAVRSRAVPLLRFDPSAEGVFGSCLDLAGNPDAATTWATTEDGRPLTPVDWAVTERRFAAHLAPLAEDAPSPTPIAEFLQLGPDERDGRTPFVVTGEGGHRLEVKPALVADAGQRLALWRTLQELAGLVTPFTGRVREDARRELAAEHASEMAGMKSEYEAKLAALRGQFEAEAVQRVTDRLMALTGHHAGAAAHGGPPS